MFCRYCGNQLPENANFCPKCGKINEVEESVGAEHVGTAYVDADIPVTPVAEDPARDALGGKCLTFGILGLAFSLSFYLSFLGIIFSAIAKSNVSAYTAMYGETTGRASVGKGLAKGGLISGIVFTALLCLYIMAIIAAVVAEL